MNEKHETSRKECVYRCLISPLDDDDINMENTIRMRGSNGWSHTRSAHFIETV